MVSMGEERRWQRAHATTRGRAVHQGSAHHWSIAYLREGGQHTTQPFQSGKPYALA